MIPNLPVPFHVELVDIWHGFGGIRDGSDGVAMMVHGSAIFGWALSVSCWGVEQKVG